MLTLPCDREFFDRVQSIPLFSDAARTARHGAVEKGSIAHGRPSECSLFHVTPCRMDRECEWNPVLKYESLYLSQDELDEDRHLVVLKDHPQ